MKSLRQILFLMIGMLIAIPALADKMSCEGRLASFDANGIKTAFNYFFNYNVYGEDIFNLEIIKDSKNKKLQNGDYELMSGDGRQVNSGGVELTATAYTDLHPNYGPTPLPRSKYFNIGDFKMVNSKVAVLTLANGAKVGLSCNTEL